MVVIIARRRQLLNSGRSPFPSMAILDPSRRQTDLASLPWQFGSVPQQRWPAGDSAGLAPADFDRVDAWLPGTVPGTVQSDLLSLGHILDPFLENNLAACRWVEGLDWWYRAVLPLQLDPGQRAFLEFDGVDTLSALFVNGQELRRHEGMFSRQTVEIPPALAANPEAELAVRLWSSDALPRYELTAGEQVWSRVAGMAQSSFRPFDDRLATLKAPMHSGWDFAPRLRTMGIWDDSRLVVCRGVYLGDVWVQAEPLEPFADPARARVRVRLTLDSDEPRAVAASIAIHPATFTGETEQRFEFAFDVPHGHSQHELGFDLPAARLWQPWERGEPCLYKLTVSLRAGEAAHSQANDSILFDVSSTRFGVRRIERLRTDRGYPWRLAVNGQPLFLRGANWVPVDALWGRARRGHYQALLTQAREAGVNFLRVWGGGGREKRAFYDLCDELGLLVWQEFPIACVFLDHLPRTERFRRLLHQESTGIVQALRNHPSLFLWCGGNEFSPRRNRQTVSTLRQVVAAEDGLRPFVAASPGPGDAHNWQVWHGLAPLAAYRDERAAFVSEFGLQAVPNVDSLRRFLSEVDLWPPGPAWQQHNADLEKLHRYAQWFGGGDITTNTTTNGRTNVETNAQATDEPTMNGSTGTSARVTPKTATDAALERFVQGTQRAQAAGLQILVEHMRRRAGSQGRRQTGGLAVWQWNDPWPAISWSVIDAFGQPKLAYETLRRIYQPVLVSLEYPLRAYRPNDPLCGTLWVVNDRLETLRDCLLKVWLDETLVHEQACSALANTATPIGQLAVALPAGFAEVRLELRQRNGLLAQNVYDLRFHDGSPRRIDQILRRRLVDVILG